MTILRLCYRNRVVYSFSSLGTIRFIRLPVSSTGATNHLASVASLNLSDPLSYNHSVRSAIGINRLRCFSSSTASTARLQSANRRTITYILSLAIAIVGLSYASVPLYRLYCQASGYGGTVGVAESGEKIEQMAPVEERELTIRFNATVSAGMRWRFIPQQKEIKIVPGETALAFYTAVNPTDIPITGIATYNVIPFDAGQYFNKIQCFCFEEQRLNAKEEVDMPVFFYIDPEFAEDPAMAKVDMITLSYTLFEAKDGQSLESYTESTSQ